MPRGERRSHSARELDGCWVPVDVGERSLVRRTSYEQRVAGDDQAPGAEEPTRRVATSEQGPPQPKALLLLPCGRLIGALGQTGRGTVEDPVGKGELWAMYPQASVRAFPFACQG